MTCLPINLPNNLPNGSPNCLPTRTGVLWLLPLLMLAMLTTPVHSQAQTQTQTPAWPAKAMRLIVPFPPGGPTDFIGRAAGSILSEALGQPVLVENRAGANGTIGLETLAKSAPDGYTVGLTAITLATAPHLGKVPFDAFKDFTYISNLVSMTPLIVANPALPAKTLPELVAYAKANPGKIAYGTPGIATVPHLGAEMLQTAAGIKLNHVPYKGATQQIQDLLAGATLVDFQSSLVVALPNVRAGKLRPIAVLTARRSPLLPEVPTVAEAGYKVQAAPWFGFGGPAGLTPEMVRRMNEALVRGMQNKDTLERFHNIGAIVHTSSAEEFSAFVRSEHARWGEVIRSAGIKLD
jgi:tripartite-type tricarboxylate transporter receptor subunit TctC